MNNYSSFGKIWKITSIICACIVALCLAAAAWYLIQYYPRKAVSFEINTPDLSFRILIATQGSEFKNGLVAKLCETLEQRPAYIKVMDVGGLDEVETREWRKVIVINTVMMSKLGRPVRRFVSRTQDRDNVLLFITSGGADFRPNDLAVDAVSGASRKGEIDRLAGLIVDWMDNDERLAWEPDDYVLTLEYFLRVDVEAACVALRSDEEHYRALYPLLEGRLNRVGYDLMKRGRLDEALKLFHLNRDIFPGSWNVYDSYAEALLANGEREAAIANYRKSLELNPDQENGIKALQEL